MPFLGMLPIGMLETRILNPMRLATTGTIIAAQMAIENGAAINFSGGYHHASKDQGGGFCIYSDIAIAIAVLRKSKKLNSSDQIVIIDVDAHQGNGLERIFRKDTNVYIFDMYNKEIYPMDMWAKKGIQCDIPLRSGASDQEYLSKLSDNLPHFLQRIDKPKIAFYNAGTDIHSRDPLGGLSVSREGVLKRDKFVLEALTKRRIPWVMVPSGGYTSVSYILLADTVNYILNKWR